VLIVEFTADGQSLLVVLNGLLYLPQAAVGKTQVA